MAYSFSLNSRRRCGVRWFGVADLDHRNGGSHLKTGKWNAVILAAVLYAATRGAYAVSSGNDPATAKQAEPAVTAAGSIDVCTHLAELKLDGVEIAGVWSQPAGAPVEGAHLPGMSGKPGEGPPISGLPAFCRVAGRIHPEPGSDIHFEVWMPAAGWDGRLNGVGTGGFAGSIDYMTLASALKDYPAKAQIQPGGDPDQASSYTCRLRSAAQSKSAGP